MIPGKGTDRKYFMIFFLNVDKTLSHQKSIKKSIIKQIKKFTKKLYMSFVFPNLLVLLRSRPRWVNACKKFNIFISSGFVFTPVTIDCIEGLISTSVLLFLLSLQTLINFFNHVFENIFNCFHFQFWTCLANPKLKEFNRLIYSVLYLGSWIQLEKITKSSKKKKMPL